MYKFHKIIFVVCLFFGQITHVVAQCVGAPTISGFTGGTNRAPIFTRCIALLASPTPYAMSITPNAALTDYKIIWGDGKADNTGVSLASGTPVNHTYDSLGEYNIQIISLVGGTCWDTIYGTVRNLRPVSSSVKPLPAGQNVGCAPHTIVFEDQTNNALPGTTLTWNFGDGTTIVRNSDSANTPISHTYAIGSVPACTTQVSLTANNANCTIGPSTYTVSPILILDRNQAVIGPPSPGSCNPSRTYTFPNSTVVNCPSLHAFRIVYWDFGDGANDTVWNTNYGLRTHTFPDTGSYTITLMDSNDCGLSVTTTVININFPPLAGFTATPKVGCMPLIVNFNDTSLGIGNTRAWLFNDPNAGTGNLNTSTLKSPIHRFDSAGTYTVRLRVSNPCTPLPAFVQTTQNITVYGKPRVLIGNLRNGCAPLTVTLTDSTKNIRTSGVVYAWDFGNGQTSTAKNPTAVTYTQAGTYQVKLIVTDTCGIDSVMRTIRVDSVPTARIMADTVCKFDTTHFNSTLSVGGAGDVLSYKWYLGTSPIDSSKTGTTAKFVYSGAGFTYRAVLRVLSDKGCRDYDTVTAKVNISPALNILTSPAKLCDTGIVSFTGDTVGSGTPLVSYRWTFGNGIIDTAYSKDTTYRFPGPGTYTIRYTVGNNANCATTVTQNVTINPLPDARPTASAFCHQQFTRFRDSSTVGFANTIDSTQWDFTADNITDSITKNPIVKFGTAGTFKVKLRVVTNNGCANTDSIDVTINALPSPAISNNGTNKCKQDSFVFGNTTTGAVSYKWQFGDATADSVTASLTDLSKVYPDTGSFLVKMIATSAEGCLDSASFTINSRPFPVAQFAVNDTLSCAPKTFVFTNTSALADAYVWRVNGVQTTTAFNMPDTTINTSGQTLLVSLIATNIYGCRPDTTQQTIQTIANPIPDFTMSADSGCGPLLVNFNNASSGATSYLWLFGNGVTSTNTDTVATYLASNLNDSSYSVKLIALNGPGCKDSISKTVTVFPKPVSSFTQSETANCGPLPIVFTNTSVHKFGGTINDFSFHWQFGNSDSSLARDPVDTFYASPIQDTVYAIRLIATSRFGCSDTAQSVVRVYPNPRASFTVNNDNGCGPLGVNFTNTSVPNDTGNISIMSFNWNFNNGLTSSAVHPASVFVANLTKDTVYPVQLIATSEHGCKDTSSRSILVFPKPLAEFTMPNDSGCSPYNLVLTNKSLPYDTGNISMMSFVWDLGNGFGSITQNAFSQYLSKQYLDSSYTIKLYATSEHGCRDTVEKNVVSHPIPVAIFSNDVSQGCGPLGVQFTSSSILAADYRWHFGDGATSMLAAPLHTFMSFPLFDTVYSVSFSVLSTYGCESDTVRGNIIARYKPVADFISGTDSICNSGPVSFTNQSIGAVSSNWNFGNGTTSAAINPVGNFTGLPDRDTIFDVRLIVTSPYSCKDTAIKQITVNPLPEAQFTGMVAGCTPLPVSFNNTSLRGVSHQWDFGDGTSSTANSPNKIFTNGLQLTTQSFLVTLKTISQSGCQDTVKRMVTVYPKPLAAFSSNAFQGCGPLSVSFSNQSAADFSGSAGMTFVWNFGTGDTSSEATPTYSFPPNPIKDTIYSIVLAAFSEFGCADTAYNVVRIFPKPTARFTVSDSMNCGPMNVSFTNTSVPNDTGSINIMSFVWDFANGFNSVQRHPSSQFINNGLSDSVFAVKLIALSEHGCKDTTTRTVTVKQKPIASFTPDRLSGCGPFSVAFTNTSLGSSEYSWNFGNGDTSTQMNPAEVYQSFPMVDSNYIVSLVTRSAFGCKSDTVRKTITGKYTPIANFMTSSDSTCNPGTISFLNVSVGGATNAWNFGNGNTSAAVNPVTLFNGPLTTDTTYQVRLVVFSTVNCTDTAYKTIKVNPLPEAVFTSVPPACTPYPVIFNNASLRASNYEWDFGDGSTALDTNPSKVFTNNVALTDRNYIVTLKAYTASGCMDTVKHNVIVNPLPLVNYTANKTLRCDTAEFQLINSSQGATSYEWKQADRLVSTQFVPMLYFNTPSLIDSTYLLKLIATTDKGCKDSITKPITIKPLVIADFTSSGSTSCANLNVVFSNQSKNATSCFWLFGDGTGSPLTSPQHKYTNTGNYDVKLIAYDAFGCSDTAERLNSVQVFEVPTANFLYSPPTVALPNSTINFSNLSFISSGNLTHQWVFGDPASTQNSSSLENPTHTFSDSGNYSVRLVVNSVNSCFDTMLQVIRIRPHPPVPAFTLNPPVGCSPLTVQFINQSEYADSYQWTFDDGQTSTDRDPIVTFKFPGKYGAFLRASGPGGEQQLRKDEIVEVFDLPEANFFVTPIKMILPNSTITLTNISNNAVAYKWRIVSEGKTYFSDSSKNSSFTFDKEGKYDVELVVRTDRGCLDSMVRLNMVEVTKGGHQFVGNAFTPDGDGINDVFKPVLQGVLSDHYTFEIYNRWGELVFLTHDINEGWDGTFDGKPANIDVYVWLVKGLYVGNVDFGNEGNVSLIR